MEPSDVHPNIDELKHIIEEARDAEHKLEKVMPNAIHAHEDEHVGMTHSGGGAQATGTVDETGEPPADAATHAP